MNKLIKAILAAALVASPGAVVSATYNLVGQRYLRLYTAPEPTQAYNAAVDAQRIADTLCTVPWRKAKPTSATSTSHVNEQLDANVAGRDKFDAALFCAEHTNGTHRAYANAAVYRYRLPDGSLPNLTRLSVRVSSDPYNDLGARVVLYANDTGDIPMDCATCRGDNPGGIKLAGLAPRITKIGTDNKSYWYPNTTNAVFTQQFRLQRYLFVFVLMENYASSRGNWLEGCSYLESNRITLATDAPVPGWTDGSTIDLTEAGYVASPDEWMPYFETTNTIVAAVKNGETAEFAAPVSAFRRMHYGSTNLSFVTHSVTRFDSDVWERGAAVSNLVGWTVTGVLPNRRVAITGRNVYAERGFETEPPSRGSVKSDSDGDGIPDGWEIYVGSDPLDPSDAVSDWDGDGLTLAEEYDDGHFSTDPRSKDTDKDTITDDLEYRYHLKGDDAALDFDGDGLSNYTEYLISKVFQIAELDPDRYATDGVTPDYFRQIEYGGAYVGEMFTDHDQVDDVWESGFLPEASIDSKPYASPSVFDPHEDKDEDGWSNYAEYKAGTSPGDATSRPSPVIVAQVRYSGRRNEGLSNLVFRAWCRELEDMTEYPDAQWTVGDVRLDRGRDYVLGRPDIGIPGRGYVREGKNKFVVFADLDSSGDYTAGEPFGFVYGVDVGWQGASFKVDLTDTHPTFARINLKDCSSDRVYWQAAASTIKEVGEGMDTSFVPSGNVRVRVVRTAVNGVSLAGMVDEDGISAQRVVMDKNFNVDIRPYLHEGDFITASDSDIDWSKLSRDMAKYPTWPVDMTNVTYRVVFGDGEIGNSVSNPPVLKVTVDRQFDTDYSTVGVSIEPFDSVVTYNTRPTFKWSIQSDGINYNSYSAFSVKLFEKDGTTEVYDSGVLPMPGYEVVDGIRSYGWTAPSIVDNLLKSGKRISRNGTYKWKVAIYNAKYKTGKESRLGTLTTAVNVAQDVNDHTYSTIPVCVKYAGPNKVLEKVEDLGDLKGKVRVQAFASADFTGVPLSETIVTNELADTARTSANGKLYGLPMNGAYYLRSYIDSNGNGQKDDWESWGAAKTIVSAGVTTPVGIWIEDADTDDDWLPDAWEFAMNNWKSTTGWIAKKGKDISGEFHVTQRLKESVTDGRLASGIAESLTGTTMAAFTWNDITNAFFSVGRETVKSVEAIRDVVRGNIGETH